jgi:hypothetical protein
MKAAFSDGLKRAAVQFGIGRYLYYLGPIWAAYNPQLKRIASLPELPEWAQPRKKPIRQLPADGTELKRRLAALDAQMAEAGSCGPGELVRFVSYALPALIAIGQATWQNHIDRVRRARRTLDELERKHGGKPVERWPAEDRAIHTIATDALRELGEEP